MIGELSQIVKKHHKTNYFISRSFYLQSIVITLRLSSFVTDIIFIAWKMESFCSKNLLLSILFFEF